MDDLICGYCSYEDKFQSIILDLLQKHELLPLKYRERQLDHATGQIVLSSKVIKNPGQLNIKIIGESVFVIVINYNLYIICTPCLRNSHKPITTCKTLEKNVSYKILSIYSFIALMGSLRNLNVWSMC